MESADLASPVGQQLVASNRTVHGLVDVVRRLRFPVNLGASIVPEFAKIYSRAGKLSKLTQGVLLTRRSGVYVDKHVIPLFVQISLPSSWNPKAPNCPRCSARRSFTTRFATPTIGLRA